MFVDWMIVMVLLFGYFYLLVKMLKYVFLEEKLMLYIIKIIKIRVIWMFYYYFGYNMNNLK